MVWVSVMERIGDQSSPAECAVEEYKVTPLGYTVLQPRAAQNVLAPTFHRRATLAVACRVSEAGSRASYIHGLRLALFI
jgi:hypothetical protein